MKTTFLINLCIGLLFITFATSCNSNTTTKEQGTDTHHEEEEILDEMAILNLVQRKAIDLKTAPLLLRPMSNLIKTTGELVVSPKDQGNVISFIGGNITEITIFEGDWVEKGTLIAKLAHPDFIEIQRKLITASSNFNYLKQAYERQEKLYINNVSSGSNFEKVKANYLSAKGDYEALKAKIKLLKVNIKKIEKGSIIQELPIYAPISGFINTVNVSLGSWVNAEQKIVSITNNKKIHADIILFETDVSKVKIGQKVRILLADDKDEIFGKIFAIAQKYKQENRSIIAHVALLNDEKNRKVGAYLSAEILLDEQPVEAVPDEAIVKDGGKSYIFVKDPATKILHDNEWAFSMKEIIPTYQNNGWTAIQLVQKLPTNTQIVMKGAYYLLSDMQKREAQHQH